MERLRSIACVTAALLFLLVATFVEAHAQDGQRLHGTVTDATGGVLVGAVVELTGGGHAETTRTDLQGRYQFNNVPQGDYVLLVSYAGFEPGMASHRVTAAGGTSTVDVSLEIAVAASEVDVAAIGSEMIPSPFSHILSGEVLEDLPSSRGALRRRLQEMAGATGRPGDIAVYVDGFRQVTRLPPRDAIQMIRISTNPFAAEFFEPGHTRVEIVTKAGFQRPSGELTLNANDGVLNARHPLAPERADVQMRNVSGYLSTPVIPRRWSLVIYGGRWEEDASDVVNALILDPDTDAPMQFNQAVVVPSLIDNVWVGSHHQLGASHSLTVAGGRTRDEARNQGLDGGLDLPEHSYARAEQEDLVRISLTSAFGPSLFNEFRAEAKRRDSSSQALFDTPTVTVLDAFTGGGNQDHLYRVGREDTLFVANHVTLARGRTTFKFGASADLLRQHDTDRTGFGGTFTFGADVERDEHGNPLGDAPVVDPLEVYRRTLLGVPGYGPSQLAIVRGDPDVDFSQWWADWFVQADWTPSPALTLSYGVRHDLQAHVPIVDGINPRIGLAWSAGEGGRDVIRLGAGTFTERVPARVTLDSRRLDGLKRQWFVLSDPGFFPEIPDDALANAVARTRATQVIDPDLRAPRLLRTSVTYDRRLPAHFVASVGYAWERGTNLLRTRNINAPTDGGRPQPDRGAILQYESTGRSERQEAVVALRTDWTRKMTAFVNYTWAESRSDTDGPSSRPADSYDLAAEYGWHREDVRHQTTAGVTLRLPRQWVVSMFAIASSGRPFNITTGRDDNRDTLFGDRPAFAEFDDPGAVVTPYGVFDPSPEPGEVRIPRNYGRDPMELRMDLHVQKAFRIGPGATRIRLGADVVNLLNNANRRNTNGVLTSPSFGTARRALDARTIELFLGVSF